MENPRGGERPPPRLSPTTGSDEVTSPMCNANDYATDHIPVAGYTHHNHTPQQNGSCLSNRTPLADEDPADLLATVSEFSKGHTEEAYFANGRETSDVLEEHGDATVTRLTTDNEVSIQHLKESSFGNGLQTNHIHEENGKDLVDHTLLVNGNSDDLVAIASEESIQHLNRAAFESEMQTGYIHDHASVANGDSGDVVATNNKVSKQHRKKASLGNEGHSCNVLRRSPRFPVGMLPAPPLPGNAKKQKGSGQSEADRNRKKAKVASKSKDEKRVTDPECFFVGEPIPEEEARARWPHHYVEKGKKACKQSNDSKYDKDEYVLGVKYHYNQASIVGCIFSLGDCAYIKGFEGKPNYIGRILEFFQTEDECYFTAQWFFRAEDTVLKDEATMHDNRRLFYSDLKNDNILDCIISKVKIIHVPPLGNLKSKCFSSHDFYYDMKYSLDFSSFCTITEDEPGNSSFFNFSEMNDANGTEAKPCMNDESKNKELALLDLYSGCGGMSTGLCLGAHFSGSKLVTRWAVDFNEAACKSLKLNHPETQVRNESVIDYFELLKEWNILCKRCLCEDSQKTRKSSLSRTCKQRKSDKDSVSDGEFEVLKLVDICYGDPNDTGKRGLNFKVRWMGYGPSDDTWEPIEGLSNCQDRIQDFVRYGFKSRILPLPGEVGVICGGPPCQGVSGLNRHRNVDAPLEDEKNKQIIVFMNIVEFLKPKYVLMENVVDILKFAGGTLGRYALSRLVQMKYQARLGIMAAGCYGLPQFRLRAFFWGCHPYKMLPQFPLPTHDIIVKGGAPTEFERNVVAYDENQPRDLENALVLRDALSDLPIVSSSEAHNQMAYGKPPQTLFQSYIRASKTEVLWSAESDDKKTKTAVLYDHCSLRMSQENYSRICLIPKRKGACFRDLPGVIVLPDNSTRRDPKKKVELLPNGNPLVPNYCFTFENGKSFRPFGRLWWDETVPTVLTTASPHFQAILHPEQDRVLTVRETARLQGFPDFYRFHGTIKERYCQIGNAVAIPVGRALGYALGTAWKKKVCIDEPLMVLPPNFSLSHHPVHHQSRSVTED